MYKKISYTFLILIIAVIIAYAGVQHSSFPPQGHTGAKGVYCTQCHRDFTLNSGGGSVTVDGLPTTRYVAGTTYNFSLIIIHGKADRKRWGFSIEAKNSSGQNIGSFASKNAHAAINGNELSHSEAQISRNPSASYTYDSLMWTAPSSPQSADKEVTFYYAANAANGDGRDEGDYIYSGSSMVTLPLTLTSLTARVSGTSVRLEWNTASESNSSKFIIEKSIDNLHFIRVDSVNATGFSSVIHHYSYVDNQPAYYESQTYYRLALLDKDGLKKYSNSISVILKTTKSFVKKLYPNPVHAGTMIQMEIISDKEQTISVQLFSASGRRIKAQQPNVIKGNNLLSIPIHLYTATGLYTLTVKTSDQTQELPLVIQ